MWRDDLEILKLNHAGDFVRLKHLFNLTHILGSPGAGKSSGAAAHLHAGVLAAQCGGLIACPKQTDFRDYMNQIRMAGREADVILMRPGPDWNSQPTNAINVLDLELNRFGKGRINPTNVTALLMKVCDLIQRHASQGNAGEAFWKQFGEKIIRAGVVGLGIVDGKIDLKKLLLFVNTLPSSFGEIEENSLFSVALMNEAKVKLGENPPYDFTLAYEFVFREWPISPPNSRGSGALTVQVMLNSLLSHPLRSMLFESTTFEFDRILSRAGILLLDMDLKTYPQAAIATMILKDVIQRACETRPELTTHEPELIQPVYQLIDEYPNYAVEGDVAHALIARSTRSIPIFISQSVSAVLSQFQNKDQAKTLLDVVGCRWAHQNGSSESNEWMANTIGKIVVRRKGGQVGTSHTFGGNANYNRNNGSNFNEQLDWDCPPTHFTRLLRGGPENRLKTEAILWRSGELFRFNKRPWLPVVFPQDFRPGHDEVSVPLLKKNRRQK